MGQMGQQQQGGMPGGMGSTGNGEAIGTLGGGTSMGPQFGASQQPQGSSIWQSLLSGASGLKGFGQGGQGGDDPSSHPMYQQGFQHGAQQGVGAIMKLFQHIHDQASQGAQVNAQTADAAQNISQLDAQPAQTQGGQ